MSTWNIIRPGTPGLDVFMVAVVFAQFSIGAAGPTVMVIFSDTTGGLWGM